MSIEQPIFSNERSAETVRVGKLRISAELLRHMLHLPESVKFRQFRSATDFISGAGCDLEMLIESDDMPLVRTDGFVQNVTAQYRTERIGDTDHHVTYFDCWRMP